jgi:flagellar assembly protein FliH
MTSSPKKIIRGANVDGVVYCTPSGDVKLRDPAKRQDQEHLKALEAFWQSKGFQEGEKKGYQDGQSQGESAGNEKGFNSGKEQGLEEGQKKGYDEGFAAGEEKVREELEEQISLLLKASGLMKEKQLSFYEDIRPEIISFATAVSECVLRKELSNESRFLETIKELLSQARPVIKDNSVDVVLNIEDHKLLEKHFDKLKESKYDAESLNFISEPSMKKGDCKIESRIGLLNFDIKRILDDLERRALEVRTDDYCNIPEYPDSRPFIPSKIDDDEQEEEQEKTNPAIPQS